MIILGIHDGHGSCAALLVNGQIIRVIEEERLTRIKKDTGFPSNAIKLLKKEHPELMENLDKIAIATLDHSIVLHATKKYPLFNIEDFLVEEERFWIPVLLKGEQVDYLEVMSDYVDYSQSVYPLENLNNTDDLIEFQEIRKNYAADVLSVPVSQIHLVDHHVSHAHHAYYSSPLRKDCIIFTMDGIGDGLNATVSKVSDSGNLDRIYSTGECNLCRMYQYITLILGMKPGDHEYKVMGLAAYAKEHYILEPLKIFEDTFYVDGLEFKIKKPISNLYQYFKKRLEGYRFDAIAGALQRYIENILAKWVLNWIEYSGQHNVLFSGGMALNIKAMKQISELDQVNNMYICPSGGDESLAIGAAQYLFTKNGYSDDKLIPISTPYVSAGFSEADKEEAIKDAYVKDNYSIINECSPRDIAKLLSSGEIVALIHGNMEFGPRALGHRSIIADPRDIRIIRVINEAIKNRDFWMPFTPSILNEYSDEYLINPKRLMSPFMTMAFDSTEKAQNDIPAAIHPYDFTVRPQIVDSETFPWYYSIIKEFENITSVGAVLNTSFNIHGRPIVHKPIDAVNEVLKHELVDLNYVVIEDLLLKKK
jgi:carbamoyltransferase